ncbi:MAG TPA: hypothetical protein PK170_00410, partial [Anaerolineae bacterium]|nr:hypothetical protein [Anaerolineae bacterium]
MGWELGIVWVRVMGRAGSTDQMVSVQPVSARSLEDAPAGFGVGVGVDPGDGVAVGVALDAGVGVDP